MVGRALRARRTPSRSQGAHGERALPSLYVALSDEDDDDDDELLLDDDDEERLLLDELLERDELLEDDLELDERLEDEDDELLAADELLDDELLAAALDELVRMPVGEAGELPHPARPDAATAPVNRSRKSRRGRLKSRSSPSSEVLRSTGLLLSDI